MHTDEKSKVKEYFHEIFSDQTEIDHWQSVYNWQDFSGVCCRARMNQALSWLDASNLPEQSVILDAGCGAGILAREVAKRGYKVFGMDYSYGMVERARNVCNSNKKLDVEFLQGDIESMPFEDSSFDMILCLGVITYLESEEKALRELSRVLKPRGILVLSSLNKVYLTKYLDLPVLVKNGLREIFGSRITSWRKRADVKKDYPERTAYMRRYFTPHLQKSLELQGFKVLEQTTIPLKLLTFCGWAIPPKKINIKTTMFLEKFSNIPLIGPLGGMCIFRLRKNTFGATDESGL